MIFMSSGNTKLWQADPKKTRLFSLWSTHVRQGRNHGKILAATSAMVGRICPPWLG
jgi:hypothetical protein